MDLSSIFKKGLEGFISSLISDALDVFDDFLSNIVDVAFNADTYMKSHMGMSFDKFYTVIYLFGIYLIVLKFLKKGFSTYILWTDGDPDMDPFVITMNFFKAIVIAVSYSILYDTGVSIVNDLINRGLNSFNNVNIELNARTISRALSGLLHGGIVMLIIALVYFILYIMLWLQFIKRGLELFLLKAGMPLACVGLMDTDGGIFKVYTKKIVQELLTVFVQIILLKLSLVFMINMHVMFALAAINFAVKTPQFLSEFIMMSPSGSGVMSKVSQASMLIRTFAK